MLQPMFPDVYGVFALLALVALAVSSVGWIKFVYFISLGYGFSIAAMGLAVLLFVGGLPLSSQLLLLLLVAYGCRLGGFLLHRELRSTSYRKEMPSLTASSARMGVGAKLAVWVSVVVLYVCQVSPVVIRACHPGNELWAFIGAGVMLAGLVLESVADFQKSAAKKRAPSRFCDSGLYRIVRCPNYFAEILFWTGCFLSGIGSVSGWGWVMPAVGYVCIVYIMFGGARRLELRQNTRYGGDEAYRDYVRTTPIILPFVPLYSVAKYTFLKG